MYAIAGPVARILLRYVGGALIAYAGLKIDANDPDLQELAILAVGAACSALSEGWYWLAHKRGWCR